MSEIIQLNVGGTFYTTTRHTLMTYQDSMLANMVSSDIPTTKDAQGRIFIDRDGKLFNHILNFLRNSKLSLPDNFNVLESLGDEADFYQIQPMIDAIKEVKPEGCKRTRRYIRVEYFIYDYSRSTHCKVIGLADDVGPIYSDPWLAIACVKPEICLAFQDKYSNLGGTQQWAYNKRNGEPTRFPVGAPAYCLAWNDDCNAVYIHLGKEAF